jgi:hypothetical protein
MDKGSLIDELFEAVKKAENCAKPNPPQNTDSLTAKNERRSGSSHHRSGHSESE